MAARLTHTFDYRYVLGNDESFVNASSLSQNGLGLSNRGVRLA
jgi:hypothetical protein